VSVGLVGSIQNPDLVPIEPGMFLMGSPATPLDVAPYFNQADAQPVHPVTISQPFWIGRHEVTQAEYQALMGANPSAFSGPSRPVERVSWHEAVAYCAALTASEQAAGRVPPGYAYRLPTEAEWEYCCRAGTTTEFHFGTALDCGQARMASSRHTGQTCSSGSTASVGGYAANAWGLRDMHGNVFEWCLDSWGGTPNYPAAPVIDPLSTVGFARVARGGSFGNPSDQCRSAVRFGFSPTSSAPNIGFRVVLAPAIP
jgi:formylglycine-generating enzyme required for sulfatase activity